MDIFFYHVVQTYSYHDIRFWSYGWFNLNILILYCEIHMIICSLPPWPLIFKDHPEFGAVLPPPSLKTLWIMVQEECTPFVWAKEALILPSPFPFSNGRPPFQPVRHFPAASSPQHSCYPVNWAFPLEALIKSLILSSVEKRRAEEKRFLAVHYLCVQWRWCWSWS